MNAVRSLDRESGNLARWLSRRRARIVFAESCTGGLVAASLARVPGISDRLCGSAVVYREATKRSWLGIPASVLKEHSDVSREITEQLARRVLARTPEATLAAAVTGHLGPNAPAGRDGIVFVSVAVRGGRKIWTEEFRILPRSTQSASLRVRRQVLASHAVLSMVRSLLEFAKTNASAKKA